jgi:hypothetical protein
MFQSNLSENHEMIGFDVETNSPFGNETTSMGTINPKTIEDENSVINDFERFNKEGLSNHFTANHGQVENDEVKYYIQGQGVWFTNSGIVIEVFEPQKNDDYNFNKFNLPIEKLFKRVQSDNGQKSAVVRFDFVNCNDVVPYGEEELPHKSNFFYGNNSSKWCTNVSNYQSIIYKNIYDNIDLKYYFNEHGLKYDFIVHPNGDPTNIIINVEGSEDIELNSEGHITVKTEIKNIIDKDLFVYQKEAGRVFEIPAEFKMIDSNCYGFKISDDYDKTMTLIIDPLIYSTYLGGGSYEYAYDIETDKDGNVYATGWTGSTNFPVLKDSFDDSINGGTDIFVTKLNSNGTALLYSTFIGGSNSDMAYGMELDSNGSAYITGCTYSNDFPNTTGAYDESFNSMSQGYEDVFVLKLSPNGDMLNFSTYIGGSYYDRAHDITLDDQNNIYITGQAYPDYPTTPGVYKSTQIANLCAFVSKLNYNGSNLICSTIIGTQFGQGESSKSITLDLENNICIAGRTASTNFPTTKGAYKETFSGGDFEGFTLKLNANMSSLLYSTFLGKLDPWVNVYSNINIHIDKNDSVIVTGNTYVTDYPTTPDTYDSSFNGIIDILIIKLNHNLSTLLYASYFGGKGQDWAYDSVLDDENNVIIVGMTNSTDFPVLAGVYDSNLNGDFDVFVTKLNLTKSELKYSSYLGGKNYETAFGVAHDRNNSLYIAGSTDPGFPTTSGSYSPEFNGGLTDVFVVKIAPIFRPILIDLNVSEPMVYRPNTVMLFSNAFDNEDLEEHLTPYFEYQEVFDPINWSTIKLSPPVYVNEQWQTTFSIPVNASLGYYDFRVRFNDTDYMWTPWFFLNGSLLVKNNPPRIDYFNLSKSSVITGEDLSVLVNGTDVEDDSQKLLFKPEYKYSMSDFWDPLDFSEMGFTKTIFEFNINISADMEYGYYDFRVKAIDCDNDTSPWSYLNKSLLVNSAPPIMISIDVSKPEIYRTEKSEVYVNCTDFDSPREELTVELQYISVAEGKWHDLSPDDMGNFWIDDIRTKKTSDLGVYNFRARATDWEDNTCKWFYLNDSFKVLNNIPRLVDIKNIPEKMDRKSSRTIFINASDKENPEDELIVVLEYRLPAEHIWIDDYLPDPYYYDDSWRYDFSLLYDAPKGKYSFRARVQDLDKDWSTYNYLNDSLLVENQIPIVISFDQLPKEIYRTETIIVTAEGSDLETSVTELECNIYYKSPGDVDWQKLEVDYNNTINKWNSELITTISSSLGNYSFKVEFKDSEGLFSKPVYANRSVWVRNNLPVISDELDDIKVASTQMILKLSDYGYDVETPKSNLKWLLDFSTVDMTLFHIDDENLDKQELAIYPVRSKQGQDDITIILIDMDNGKAVKTDVTIIVNSKTGGKDQLPGQDNPIESMVGSSNVWLYILILIMVIMFIIILIFYRRKKQKEQTQKEEDEKKAEVASVSESGQELPAAVDETIPVLEGTAPEVAPAIEAPKEPVPVPMPVEAPKPQLPEATAQQDTIIEPEPQPPLEDTQTQPLPQVAKAEPEIETDEIEEQPTNSDDIQNPKT